MRRMAIHRVLGVHSCPHLRLLLTLLFALGACRSHAPELPPPPKPSGPAIDPNAPIATMRVGLPQGMPRPDLFQAVLAAAWRQQQPRVALQFVAWDGGHAEDPYALRLDVFVFQSLFLDDLRARGRLRSVKPADVPTVSDFMPYSIRELLINHEYSGIPLLGNASLLFFRRGDEELGQALTLSQMVNAVGTCVYTGQVPHDGRGLLLGLANGYTQARFYVDATEAAGGNWPIPLPMRGADLDPLGLGSLRTLLQSASFYNSTREPADPRQRARWFAQGFGRAVVGPPDSLWAMGAARAGVDFKLLPLGEDPTVRRVFSTQIVGVAPNTSFIGWSLELAQLMTSTEFAVALLAPKDGQPSQYLLPVRRSALRQLGRIDPAYRKLQQVADRAQPYLMNLGPRARQWLAAVPGELQRRLHHGFGCGCDQPVAIIQSQNDASEKCLSVCGGYDGWTGQWSAGRGRPSTCACRSCF